MDAEEVRLNKVKCILCRGRYDPFQNFKNIKDTTVQRSRKTIKDVLNHLSKCIKGGVVLLDTSYVCGACYEKLVEYDQIMIQLLVHQKELTQLLESSMSAVDNSDDEVKSEPLSDDSLSSAYDFGPVNKKPKDRRSSSSTQGDQDLDLKDMPHTKNAVCKICGILCKDEELLELHMNIHEGKSEYECKYCPKRYTRKSNVIRHMHLHWDKKEFQCEICGLRFSQTNLLYGHRQTHESDETPLNCDKCDQTFKTRKTLYHHLRTHQEDRPMHSCEICGKRFTERYTLKLHLKTHQDPDECDSESSKKTTSIKKQIRMQLPCIICNEMFASKEILDKHMEDDHDVVHESSVYF